MATTNNKAVVTLSSFESIKSLNEVATVFQKGMRVQVAELDPGMWNDFLAENIVTLLVVFKTTVNGLVKGTVKPKSFNGDKKKIANLQKMVDDFAKKVDAHYDSKGPVIPVDTADANVNKAQNAKYSAERTKFEAANVKFTEWRMLAKINWIPELCAALVEKQKTGAEVIDATIKRTLRFIYSSSFVGSYTPLESMLKALAAQAKMPIAAIVMPINPGTIFFANTEYRMLMSGTDQNKKAAVMTRYCAICIAHLINHCGAKADKLPSNSALKAMEYDKQRAFLMAGVQTLSTIWASSLKAAQPTTNVSWNDLDAAATSDENMKAFMKSIGEGLGKTSFADTALKAMGLTGTAAAAPAANPAENIEDLMN